MHSKMNVLFPEPHLCTDKAALLYELSPCLVGATDVKKQWTAAKAHQSLFILRFTHE